MKSSQIALSAFVATSLVSAPVVASAAPVQASRAGSAVEGEALAAGMGPAWLVAALIAAVLITVVVSDGDDEDSPVSP